MDGVMENGRPEPGVDDTDNARKSGVHDQVRGRQGNVPVRSALGFAARTPNTKTLKHLQTSTRHNSTSMAAIDKALAAIKLRELGDKIIYQQYADKYNVSRSALSRRHRGVSCSRADYTANKQSLALQ